MNYSISRESRRGFFGFPRRFQRRAACPPTSPGDFLDEVYVTDWQVITGDCLEVMPTLAPGSVDAILTDLPYGTTACSWDSVIPFAPMWAAIKHVLKPRGVFVTTASQPFTSALVMSNPKWFKYEWVWNKDRATGHLDATRRPMRKHENITVFSQNGHTYNPQIADKPIENIRPVSRRAASANYGKYKEYAERGIPLDKTYPQTVLQINTVNIGERGIHPTQKPVALYEYLIRTYTNEGELVLDMCAGSGTTGVAAINTGRRVICIEQREDYADIARARIAKAAEQARQEPLPL